MGKVVETHFSCGLADTMLAKLKLINGLVRIDWMEIFPRILGFARTMATTATTASVGLTAATTAATCSNLGIGSPLGLLIATGESGGPISTSGRGPGSRLFVLE